MQENSSLDLSETEYNRLETILEDLRTIIGEETIDIAELESLGLESEEVYNFLDDLRNDAKPEYALRDELLAGTAVLGQYLFGPKSPETSITTSDDETVGKIDYEIRDESILVELKPLFNKYKRDGGIQNLQQISLDWRDHQEQIEKYLRQDYEYLIFTNLKDWYIFSGRRNGPINEEPLTLNEYLERLDESHGSLRSFLERFEQQDRRDNLDEDFFESLQGWVTQLEDVEFREDTSEQKTEKIIEFINKFIFIRTLDDHSVVRLNWIESEWQDAEDSWGSIGERMVLEEFLSKVNRWFYRHYDTDLFPLDRTLLDDIVDEDENIQKFYRTVKRVLGLESWQQASQNSGITGFRYRDIDEDIYGKAYETFLAEKRNEEGIFYTPKYITEDIVETNVEPKFDEHIEEFERSIDEQEWAAARESLEEMTEVRIIDPACGSGSFLIKTLRLIWDKYDRVVKYINQAEDELKRDRDDWYSENTDLDEITEMKSIVNVNDERERISQILIRHIHGNDLDTNALSVAKVNIWKEAIKLASNEFYFEDIPDGGGYTLPHLHMNFGRGDALLGLPDEEVIDVLKNEHQEELTRLFALRRRYMQNPEHEELVQEIGEIKSELNDEFRGLFETHLQGDQFSDLEDSAFASEVLSESTPLHWALDFWYVYFDESLEPLEDPGFDVVIGNPPYERMQTMRETKPNYVEYLNQREDVKSTFGNWDIAVPFIEKGYNLLSKGGNFGYIVTKKWMTSDYGEKIREYLAEERAVDELIDFGSEQVFDDPATYTTILSLKRDSQEKFRYAQITQLTGESAQLDEIHQCDEQKIESNYYVTIENNEDLDEGYWAFGTADEEEILEKLDSYDRLDDICDEIFVGLQTSADPVYIVEVLEDRGDKLKVYSKHKDDNYIIEKGITKPILKGSEIERWAIRGVDYALIFPYDLSGGSADLRPKKEIENNYRKTWEYLTDCKTKLKDKRSDVNEDTWWEFPYPKNLSDFEQPKIITQVNANYASFAHDSEGTYYFVGGGTAGGYGVSFKKDETDLRKRVLGLLNSYLLDWRVKHESSEFRGKFFSFAQRYMVDLPIAEPDDESEFVETVDRLVALAKARYTLEGLWMEKKPLATTKETLAGLLETDKQKRQYGDGGRSWFEDVEFYPDDDNDILEREHEDFLFRADTDTNQLTIHALHGEVESQIYSVKFQNTKLLNIVYLSMKELFDSRKKIEKLSHILEKTEVPVITPNSAENTPHIMEEIESGYDTWANENDLNIDGSPDVVELENREKDIFAQLNADVFNMYDLDRDEAMTVMNKTNILHQERDQILDLI